MNKKIYRFREAQTEKDYNELYALRYQVYCIENNWLPFENYPDKLEKDEYDPCSKHFIAENEDGVIVGTIRLILSDNLQRGQSLPIDKHPHVSRDSFSLNNCAEVSRLVVDKQVRQGDISLGLYRIMYQYSSKSKLDYWYICVDKILLKLLQKLDLPFQAFADPGDYMGTTVPAKLQVSTCEQHLLKNNKRLAKWFLSSPYDIKEEKLISKFLRKQDQNTPPKSASMSTDLFSRNWAFIPKQIQDKLADTRLFIAGAGLGSVIAERAVRTGFGKFIIADGDNVELSNLNRQVFAQTDIARNKARITADIVKNINKNADVEVIEEYLTPITLEDPILRSDVIINTIDFDHPAFLDCNRQAQKYGKPVLFPLNIGWGGALLIFAPHSPLLEDFLGLVPNATYSFDQIKQKLIRKIVSSTFPDYLLSLVDIFESPSPDDWQNDPQLAIGCAISASLAVTAATSLISNNPVRIVPDFIYVDFYELLRQKQ